MRDSSAFPPQKEAEGGKAWCRVEICLRFDLIGPSDTFIF
jgi:hypothetical protein